jgi:hypothetical protein
MLWSGEWAWRHEPGAASSEAEIRPRGRVALERGGDSPEGARSPRARRRSVLRHLALERDGSPLEGCWGWLLDGPLRLFGPWASLRIGLWLHEV